MAAHHEVYETYDTVESKEAVVEPKVCIKLNNLLQKYDLTSCYRT